MRLILCAVVLSALAVGPVSGHPHEERVILTLRGSLTSVDLVDRTVAFDTVDPGSKRVRNLLVFLDKKVKLRRGKSRIALGDLKAGQEIDATVELTHDDGDAERFVALEIRLR